MEPRIRTVTKVGEQVRENAAFVKGTTLTYALDHTVKTAQKYIGRRRGPAVFVEVFASVGEEDWSKIASLTVLALPNGVEV